LILGLIVEGHGDVRAAPILVRRLLAIIAPEHAVQTLPPHRIPRSRIVLPTELERAVELMSRRVGPTGAVLVLVDCDDDCSATLGPKLLLRAQTARPDRKIAVVLARREFESWFLAAARSLRGKRGLPSDLEPPPAPEEVSGAKEWLAHRMPNGYSETLDQPAFAAAMDLDEAVSSRSFRKLRNDLSRIMK
jgi:Domain of unknown function (DUF4276)